MFRTLLRIYEALFRMCMALELPGLFSECVGLSSKHVGLPYTYIYIYIYIFICVCMKREPYMSPAHSKKRALFSECGELCSEHGGLSFQNV